MGKKRFWLNSTTAAQKIDDWYSDEHKIYIEDYLKDEIGSRPLEVDEEIAFSEDLIREAIEASLQLTPEQLEIREVNSSIYMFDNAIVYPLLSQINNNNIKGEYYLVDIIGFLKERNYSVYASVAKNHMISVGINNKWELQEAQEQFNQEHLKKLALEDGVTCLQPATITIEYGVKIGRDTIIYPSTYIGAGTTIGQDCRIGPFTFLQGVEVTDGQVIISEKRMK